MDASTFIKVELVKHHKTMRQLYEMFGICRQAMTKRMNRNVWQLNDLEKIANWLDCDLVVEFRPRR